MLQSINVGEESQIPANIKHSVYCWVKFKHNYLSSMWHWVENHHGVVDHTSSISFLAEPTFVIYLLLGCLRMAGRLAELHEFDAILTDFFHITMI